MGFQFRAVVQLPGDYPDLEAAERTARKLFGWAAVVGVVSNASDEVGAEESGARRRNRKLGFREDG